MSPNTRIKGSGTLDSPQGAGIYEFIIPGMRLREIKTGQKEWYLYAKRGKRELREGQELDSEER